jgi:hypothetical protein
MCRSLKDIVLDRWFAGEGRETIAKDFGHGRGWTNRIIRQARANGDPRAISHAHLAAGTEGWRQHYKRKNSRWVFDDAALSWNAHHAAVGAAPARG